MHPPPPSPNELLYGDDDTDVGGDGRGGGVGGGGSGGDGRGAAEGFTNRLKHTREGNVQQMAKTTTHNTQAHKKRRTPRTIVL